MPAARHALLLALVLPAVFLPTAFVPAHARPAGAAAVAAPAYAPVSDFLAGRRVGPDLQTRLDASMARLEALSLELRAAVGDAPAYARLRDAYDREVKTHKALTGEANRAFLPMGSPS